MEERTMVISSVVMRAVLPGRKGGFVVSLALIVAVANPGKLLLLN
jgi:hypothetical protein